MAPEPPKSPRPLPTSIGRYKIVSRIGKGAMGVVYHAHDELMDRAVAIKVLTADLAGDPSIRTRFFREAKVAGQIVHANVITVFDMGEENGRLYIVMELLQGQTLGEYMREHPDLSLAEKIDVMTQVCSGMVAAHARGVVHRDLKPSNLFVQTDGVVKLLDFGVARLADSNVTAAGLIIGTPDYMSPEQARGGEIDARADVFSAGAVFYYLLTGRRPFVAKDLPALLHQVEFLDPPPIPEQVVPPAVAAIVFKALQKDPARRYQSFNDLLADVLRFHKTYDAELRRTLQAARGGFSEARALAEARRAAAAELGLELPADDEIATLISHHPGLAEGSGADARGGFAKDLPQMAQDVQQVRDRLAAEAKRLEAWVERMRAAEAAWETGDLASAEQALLDLAREQPAASKVQHVLRQVQEAHRRFAERALREQEMLADAVAACDAGRWTQAVRVCDELLEMVPASVRAQELRAHASRELAQQAAAAERREQAMVRAGEAGAALAAGDLATAFTLAQDAHSIDATCAQAVDVLARVQAARQEAAVLAERAERLAAHVTHARDWLGKGRLDRAQQQIDAARQIDAGHADVEALTAELGARQQAVEAQRAAARQARAASIKALLSNGYLWAGIAAIVVLAVGGWLVSRLGGSFRQAEPEPTPAATTTLAPNPATPANEPAPPASTTSVAGATPVTPASPPPAEGGQASPPVQPPANVPDETGLPALPQRPAESVEQWTARRRDTLARFNEGQALLQRGRFQQALAVFEALARTEPEYPGIQERLSATRRELENTRPTPQRLFAEGQRLENNGDMLGAMDRYRAAAAGDPNVAGLAQRITDLQNLMVNRALRLISQAEAAATSDVARAVRLFEEALRYLPPDHPRAAAVRRELERLRGGAN